MKRTLIFVVSLTGLLMLPGVFLLLQKGSRGPGKMFQVKNPGHITRILFSENTETLEVKKKGDIWMVNGQWKVRSRAIKVLKKVVARMEVKSPVSGNLKEEILNDPKTKHLDVLIFRGVIPLRRFEVCRNVHLPGGNMMKQHGKKKWYIVYLPGENIDPAALFVMDPYYWRDRTLFHYLPGEVREVSFRYGDTTSEGFRVGLDTLSGHYFMQPLDSGKPVLHADTTRIKIYLSYFQQLDCDAFDHSVNTAEKDSLLEQKPLYSLTIEDFHGKEFSMDVYPLPGKNTETGKPAWDPDVARAFVRPINEIVLVKYYRIDPLVKDTRYFYETP